MFNTWTDSDDDAESLARKLEGHLNEYAEDVISVSYSVDGGRHHVLAVYRPVELFEDGQMEAVVSIAESIVEATSH